ncbi:MAG: shikimate kinase [Pseudomonadota bacterium]
MSQPDRAESQRHAPGALRLTRPVVLIGLMGAGKTSVGQRLATQLQAPFHDSDHEIETAAQMQVAEIFEQFGEPEFRRLECRVIARLLEGGQGILATGGGAFMQEETRAAIAERAVSVWLKADLEVLVARTSGRSHRPLLNTGDPEAVLSGLIERRYPLYALADLHVESVLDQTHEDMSERIIEGLARIGAVKSA